MVIQDDKEGLFHFDFSFPSFEYFAALSSVVPSLSVVIQKPGFLQNVNAVEPALIDLSHFKSVHMIIHFELEISEVLLVVDLFAPEAHD